MRTLEWLITYINERIVDNTGRKIQPWVLRLVLTEIIRWADEHYVSGNKGETGADGKNLKLDVIDGWIRWALEDSSTWNNLVNLETLKGLDGQSPQFNNNGTHIQVRLGSSGTWTDLIALETLRGPKGAGGSDGVDGKTPNIGENKNWWINGVDTGIRAEGQNGYTPYIGENKNWWINGVDTGIRAEAEAESTWAAEEW